MPLPNVGVHWARGARGGPDVFEVYCDDCGTVRVAASRTVANEARAGHLSGHLVEIEDRERLENEK